MLSLAGGGLLGAALILVNNANGQTVTRIAPPSIEPTTDGHVVYSAPVSVSWALAYPHAASNLTATNRDGWSNLQKMARIVPPDDQSTVVQPSSAASVISTPSTDAVASLAQKRQQLHAQAAAFHAAAAQNQQVLERRAAAANIPLRVDLGGGKLGTLVDIDETGHPTYATPYDIYSAATSHSDQLWPANSVDAVSGWTTGSSGLNLDGGGQLIDMFEADETIGNAGVDTSHYQFADLATGLSRVTQGDAASTGVSSHATAVAGMLASGGRDDSYNIGANVNLGNYSRGIGYAGTVKAWSLTSYAGNFIGDAGDGVQLANNSWGTFAGWGNDGTHWIWYGGNNANVTDWQFGAYVNSYSGSQGIAPRQLDNLSYLSPNMLLVFAAGNFLGVGPGQPVTYYLNTDTTFSNPQTATKNWTDGDAGGYRTISPNASAKNVLSVGGVLSITPGYTSPSDVLLVAPYTGVGPTTDGRIKPEVVAPSAVNPTVTSYNPYGFSGFIEPGPTSLSVPYEEWLGTSFAAPSGFRRIGFSFARTS